MQTLDILIIGGGLVGLSAAGELAGKFPGATVALLERNDACCRETSSRSSEVIHAGIYYARDSLRAKLCVEGKALLYEFCRSHAVPHRRIGKLIVAADSAQEHTLNELMERGQANGVSDLALLGRQQVQALEPHIRAAAALWSASTGIVDSHVLAARLAQHATRRGAAIACRHEVTGIEPAAGGYRVRFTAPDGRQDSMRCSWVVNCAGLGAERIAACAGMDTAVSGCRQFFCKGEYFRIPAAQGSRINHLVYPPPYKDLLGLGIHVTKSMDGSVRLGPNAFYVRELDYDVDPGHAGEFYEGVRDFLPFIRLEDLQPDTAGIRPKLQGPGDPACDFLIRHEQSRGLPGFINLIGIESPGLTACLALGKTIAGLIEL